MKLSERFPDEFRKQGIARHALLFAQLNQTFVLLRRQFGRYRAEMRPVPRPALFQPLYI